MSLSRTTPLAFSFFYDDGGEREVSLTFTTPASVMFDGQSIDLLFDFFGLRPSDANQRTSLWLGTFDQRFFNPELNEGWIRHEEHGWLYASGRGYDRGIWFWDHIQQDWLWSRASVYPFFFSDRRMTWIYYRSGGRPESRDFYSYETEAKGWFKVES